ncbi:MAG: glycerophosphodiester phosphodiesterase family protein [Sphingobium sp.]
MTRRGAFDSARLAFLPAHAYAHRGLHRPGGPVENSLPAFDAALAAGHGMECDVRLSRDGIPYIFHDALLDRLTSESGPLSARTADQLDRIELNDASGPLPRLSALLRRIGGRAPLLIEVKIDRQREVRPLCAAVLRDLRDYSGPVAIMSFHPGVSHWFHRHAPGIVRGLVITDRKRAATDSIGKDGTGKDRGLKDRMLRHLAMCHAHPDFIAYDIRDLPNAFARTQRRRGMPVLSWTVRSAAHWDIIRAEADAAIFEQAEG